MPLTDELVEKAKALFGAVCGDAYAWTDTNQRSYREQAERTIAAALADAIAAERERCAKVAETWHVLRDGDMTIAKLAAAIRRGD